MTYGTTTYQERSIFGNSKATMSYKTEGEFPSVCGGQGLSKGRWCLREVAGGLEQGGWDLGRVSKGLGAGA